MSTKTKKTRGFLENQEHRKKQLTGRQTTNSNVTVSTLQEYDISKANVSLLTGQFIQQTAVWTTYSLNLEDTSLTCQCIELGVEGFKELENLVWFPLTTPRCETYEQGRFISMLRRNVS